MQYEISEFRCDECVRYLEEKYKIDEKKRRKKFIKERDQFLSKLNDAQQKDDE